MRLRLLLRQATSSIGASIAIIVIVAISAGLLTAWPRLLERSSVAEFNYRLGDTPTGVRALQGHNSGTWLVQPDAPELGALLPQVQAKVDSAGPTLRPLLGEPHLLLSVQGRTAPIPFDTPDPGPTNITGRELMLRASPGFADHVQIVDGEAPDPWAGMDSGEPLPLMVSTEIGERLGLEVGEQVILPGESNVFGDARPTPDVVVSGLFDARDDGDPIWPHHPSAISPYNRGNLDVGDILVGAAYVHPDSAGLLQLVGDVTPELDVWIDVEGTSDDPAAFLDDLRGITAQALVIDAGMSVEIPLETALIDVLTDTVASQQGTDAVLTMVAAGPVGVTFAVLALACRLSTTRRSTSLALASARGGSPLLLRGALGIEGLVLGVPAAAVGMGAAILAVPGPVHPSDYLLVLAVALAPAVFLAAERLPNLRTQRSDASVRSQNRWRWVVETLLVVATAGALYLLLSRDAPLRQTASVDPLTAGAPLLAALTLSVLTLRVFPWLMTAVHAAMRRRRTLAGFLGSARAIRERGASLAPLLTLLVATSIALFSTALLSTISVGLQESSYAVGGADVRMTGPAYFDEVVEEIEQTDGVTSTARVYETTQVPYTVDGTTRRIDVYAVDSGALGDVQAPVPGAVDLPEGMDELVDGAVPVVASPGLGESTHASVLLGVRVDVTPIAVVAQAPGVAQHSPWVIVDLELMREATGQPMVPRTLLVDLADDADPATVSAALSQIVDGAGDVVSASAREEAFLQSPNARSAQIGAMIALGVSVLQSVVALVLALVLAAPARQRLIAILRALGLEPRQGRALVSWELVPLGVVAIVAGTALGLALPHLVVATVDLTVFAGQASPRIVYDWGLLALVLAVLVVVLGLTLVLASALARRLSLTILRIGDAT